MMRLIPAWVGVVLAVSLVSWPAPVRSDDKTPAKLQPLVEVFAQAERDGKVVGAQLVVGNRTQLLHEQYFGVVSPGANHKVDFATLFCIGSCSKPIVAALILALAELLKLPLDAPIDRWLPEFGRPALTGGGRAQRAPTLAELLAHQGGIYSQRQSLSKQQTKAIRDFTLTLEQSVGIIATQPLLHEPGSGFAYSGAGYCVAGRVMEAATKTPLETLVQEHICRPVGMKRTTYFPDPMDANVAVGGSKGDTSDAAAPRAAKPLRLPLVGGSLHSTGRDLAAFSQLMLNQGKVGDRRVLSTTAWQALTSRHFAGSNYGYGWTLEGDRAGAASVLSHGGSLASYRGLVVVHVESGDFLVALWDLPAGLDQDPIARPLRQRWTEWMKSPEKCDNSQRLLGSEGSLSAP